jgi:transposase
MLDDPKLHAGEAGRLVGYKSDYPGCNWVKRFNQQGIKGLQDEERSGRPLIYNENIRGSLINMALQKPASLGYPFALWTESRLQAAFQERYGFHLSSYTIWTWVTSEGLKWKRQQSWFHEPEKHDPEFVQKRGSSSRHTPGDA